MSGEFYDKDDRFLCRHCEEHDREPGEASERFSFGIYAGWYCDTCLFESGFRDATDPDAEFSELDAGEQLEPEEDIDARWL